jgi:hypothetical protein
MPVSKRIRFEVLRRDGHACRYCGGKAPDVRLTVDHVMPVALGGSDDPTNLVAACVDCNAGKASVAPDAPIVADVADDQLRWARAMEAAAANLLGEQRRKREVIAAWLEEWEKWSEIDYLPVDFHDSVWRFHCAGLPLEVLTENAFRATGARHVSLRNQFRYFCGICNNQIRDMSDLAMELVREEDVTDGA